MERYRDDEIPGPAEVLHWNQCTKSQKVICPKLHYFCVKFISSYFPSPFEKSVPILTFLWDI